MTFDFSIFWDALTSGTFFKGALLTLGLAISSHAVATLLGLGLALAKGSRQPVLRHATAVYLWLFRGTPTLLQLLFVWNALPQLITPLQASWFSPFIAAFIALAFNESAYMAEIVRSGLLSVDPGQRLAARALGMTSPRILRRVILPQAIRVIIPPTGNEFISLLKITSLASVISLRELLTVTSQNVAVDFRFAELYGAAAVYYLAMTSLLMLGQARLERRFIWTSGGRRRRPRPETPSIVTHEAR